MNPFLSKELAKQHIADLRREARESRVPSDFRELADEGRVTVRAYELRDRDAVRLLAALEGTHVPDAPTLVAEVNGEVLAALPLDGGPALGDPFRRTEQLVTMLEMRARQLRAERRKQRRLPHFGRHIPRTA